MGRVLEEKFLGRDRSGIAILISDNRRVRGKQARRLFYGGNRRDACSTGDTGKQARRLFYAPTCQSSDLLL
ncbi:MAG: hypothetical protein SXA11_01705 [Cyanobacteriota bacterium]|nr:hypothetical protein [Cyanobacteriota bacterium]